MRKVGDSRRCRIFPGLGGTPRELRFLYARFLKLKAGDSVGPWCRLRLREMFQCFPDAFVIALTVIAAAEIFVEQPSQRPQVLSAVLAAHYSCALP